MDMDTTQHTEVLARLKRVQGGAKATTRLRPAWTSTKRPMTVGFTE